MNATVRVMRASRFRVAETGASGDPVAGHGLGEQSALVEQPRDVQPATEASARRFRRACGR